MSWHAVLTGGQKDLWKAFRYSRRCAGRQFGKAVLVLGYRLLALGVVMVNLHLFLRGGLWIAEELAGFNWAYLGLIFAPDNPVYILVLGAGAWWLLAPYLEAIHYLFYSDARTRFEGLDLWYRVEQLFPIKKISKVGAYFLVAAASWLVACPARAETRLEVVQKVRKDLAEIKKQVAKADPYPGGDRWQEELHEIGERLDPDSDSQQGRYSWYHQEIDDFRHLKAQDDLKILETIDQRLQVIEKSLGNPPQPRGSPAKQAASGQNILEVVPPSNGKTRTPEKKQPEPEEFKQPEPEEDQNQPEKGQKGQPGQFVQSGPKSNVGVVNPVSVGAGVGQILLMVFLFVVGALLVIGIALAIRFWLQNRKKKVQPKQKGRIQTGQEEEYLENPDHQNVQSLWREADDLARQGRYLEALRRLYLAVLALLHQAHLIRYERTRTNGEYADQLRKLPALHPVFLNLTGMFEVKWYGEKACEENEYFGCRQLADEIQQQSKSVRE